MSYEELLSLLQPLTSREDVERLFNEILGCREVDNTGTIDTTLLFKLIGLIVSDGPVSRLIKQISFRCIRFRGLSLGTLYAVLISGCRAANDIVVKVSRQNTARISRTYFDIRLCFPPETATWLIRILKTLLGDPSSASSLDYRSSAGLLAGLIDGDGYVGQKKRHLIIAYDKESIKGALIDSFLKHLSSRNLIALGSYRGRPHYERYVRFVNLDFARATLSLVFHPKRRQELAKLVSGIARNIECRLSISEIINLLLGAESGYIDTRESEKGRKVPVLVLYQKKGKIRKSIKITSKCIKELEEALSRPASKHLKDRILKITTEYVNTLKAFKQG